MYCTTDVYYFCVFFFVKNKTKKHMFTLICFVFSIVKFAPMFVIEDNLSILLLQLGKTTEHHVDAAAANGMVDTSFLLGISTTTTLFGGPPL